MLRFITLGLVILLTTEIHAAKPCKNASDCGDDECCLMIIPLRGKRQTKDQGYCSPKGAEKDNCYVNNRFSVDGRHANKCPCGNGYQCDSIGVMDIPQGMLGVCGPTQVLKEKPCSSGADCGDDECCQSRMRPLGKRSLSSSGVCKKLGVAKSSCLVKMASVRPKTQVFQCPCSAGFTCKGNGLFDIPLGETGFCS